MPYFERRGLGDDLVSPGLIGGLMVVLALLLGALIATSLGVDVLNARGAVERLGLGDLVRGQMSADPQATAAATAVPATPEVASAARARLAPTAASAAGSPLAPFCTSGQRPSFVLGFGELKQRLGAQMGEPLECEHANAENGDALQQTTSGLAYYRQRTNTAMFTDGWRHWALTPEGLATWEGDATDPPPGAVAGS
ncbi:MAG: hypothetical protein HY690_05275 [Chloroflexi bacterium]|nr:hypothetical protein [Chloroflexota bacterium]